jgi:hypothetical protein
MASLEVLSVQLSEVTGGNHEELQVIIIIASNSPWNRIIETLILAPLVKKFLAFCGTRKSITVFTRARR